MNVGTHYDRNKYNCAHFVADWYEHKLDVTIPVVNEFSMSFLIWMRKNFIQISRPENHCLVKMKERDGSAHIGVYYQHRVHHNFKPMSANGSVCKSTLGTIKTNYYEVTYWKWLR